MVRNQTAEEDPPGGVTPGDRRRSRQPVEIIPPDRAAAIWPESEARGGVDAGPISDDKQRSYRAKSRLPKGLRRRRAIASWQLL